MDSQNIFDIFGRHKKVLNTVDINENFINSKLSTYFKLFEKN